MKKKIKDVALTKQLRTTMNFQALTLDLAKKTAQELRNNRQTELSRVQWTLGESNPDREYSQLCCVACVTVFEKMKTSDAKLHNISIKCHGPDLNITYYEKGMEVFSGKIELKTSKALTLLGSTSRTLDVNMPVIYTLRPSKRRPRFQVKASQYHQLIKPTSRYDLFQDRSPRPSICFQQMNEEASYIEKTFDDIIPKNHYAQCAVNRVHRGSGRSSWQDTLVKDIIELTKNKHDSILDMFHALGRRRHLAAQ